MTVFSSTYPLFLLLILCLYAAKSHCLSIANVLHCQSLSNACITSLYSGRWNRWIRHGRSLTRSHVCQGELQSGVRNGKTYSIDLNNQGDFFSQTSIMSRICDNLMLLETEPLPIFCLYSLKIRTLSLCSQDSCKISRHHTRFPGRREATRTPAYFHFCHGVYCMTIPNWNANREMLVSTVQTSIVEDIRR